MKLIVHVGAPKTATTSLQHALKDNRDRLLEQGISYVPTGKLRNSELGQSLRDETPSFFNRVSKRAVRGFVERWADAEADRLLMSDEGYTTYLMHPSRHGAWAKQAKRTFRILKHFDSYDFRVVLTVRRQDSYLASCYAHLVRHGRVSADFETYWRGLDLGTMSWLGLVEAMRREYGDRLTVLPFERIRDGFPAYYRAFVHHGAGVPEDRIDDMQPENNELNLSLSAPAIDLALIVNRHLAPLRSKLGTLDMKAMIKDIRDYMPLDQHPKFAPDTTALRAALAERFRDENRELSERYLADRHSGFEF